MSVSVVKQLITV